MPNISVILPTYNGEKYIRQSIDSILMQTYKDWELIVVDDCSTDSTLQIIEKYTKKDERIKIIHNEKNQKLPKSLNIGFAKAKGKYLTWTSDDNLYLPEALETMYNFLEKEKNSYMVCAKSSTINDVGMEIGELPRYDSRLIYLNDCVGACFLYRREVLEKIGAYDPKFIYVEDYDYWIRILECYGRIDYIDEKLYQYRHHLGSLTETKKEQITKQLLLLRKKHIQIITKNLQEYKEILLQIYCDFLYAGYNRGDIPNELIRSIPNIEMNKIDKDKKYIIFGAGNYGEKAKKILKAKVAFFCDNDLDKVGNFKDGIEIISVDELKKIHKKYNIIIAISDLYVYKIIKQLQNMGISEYCTYQMLITMQK